MKKIWIGGGVIFILVLIYTLTSGEGGSEQYIKEIANEIEGRKRFLQHNDQSPFILYGVPYIEPKYFDINPDYKVNARVERLEKREFINLGTSSGKSENYLKYAWLHFSINGEKLKLLVLKPSGLGAADYFFCGFADATSGTTTYAGGRYLDVTIGKSDKTTLDFNLAYNPYCAYIDEYSCPLPPSENILPIAIEAGELLNK